MSGMRRSPSGQLLIPDPSLSPGNLIRAAANGLEYEFCEEPEDGSILQYNASLGLYVPVAGPGAIQPLSVEPLTDVSEPVVLYQFPSLSDLGPNGVDLTVAAGTAVNADMIPGSVCTYLETGTRLESSAAVPAMQLTGDMTIWAIMQRDSYADDFFWAAYSGPLVGDLVENNHLYRVGMRQSALPRNMDWFQEDAAAGNHSFTTPSSGNGSPSIGTIHVPLLVTAVRRVVGAESFIQFYVGASAFGSEIGPQANAAGGNGADTRFYIGGGDLSSGVPARVQIQSLMITDTAASATDVALMNNFTMGPVFGEAAVP